MKQTKEQRQKAEQDYRADYKKWWIETDWMPESAGCCWKNQEKFMADILEREIDLDKIETVLEVGCGYGRICKVMYPKLQPNLRLWKGIDISQTMCDYFKHNITYKWTARADQADFEEFEIKDAGFDMVISVETMTALPPNANVRMWIGKMVNMAKKYVVNLDWYREDGKVRNTYSKPWISNMHDYPTYYEENRNVLAYNLFPIPRHENATLFIARVK